MAVYERPSDAVGSRFHTAAMNNKNYALNFILHIGLPLSVLSYVSDIVFVRADRVILVLRIVL